MMIHILLCVIWTQIVSITGVVGNNTIEINELLHSSTTARHLQQQSLNYRATYRAEFLHQLDFFCTGDKPILEVTCLGTAMTILNTSDPTIICTQASFGALPGSTTYVCQNTCDDTTCESIYSTTGRFAFIEFMCEGDDYEQIDAVYTYTGGMDGSCSSSSTTSTQNYHIARLGVSCPIGSSRDYIYDDTFSECINYGALGGVTDYTDDDEVDFYTCFTGNNCKGLSCVVPFANISMISDVTTFLETCVERIVDLTNIPTISPMGTSSLFFSAQFEASWAKLYDTATAKESCTSENPSIIITCGDFAKITYVDATDTSVNCTQSSSESEMICVSDGTNVLLDTFTSVFFNCTGSTVPTAQIFYPESSVSCTDNTIPATVSNAITLGVFCEVEGQQFFYHYDLGVECGDSAHNFFTAGSLYGFNETRIVCSESAMFPVGSTSTTQTINNVSIYTDWVASPEGCYLLNGQPTGAVAAPVPAPTTSIPLSIPTNSPIITNVPITSTVTVAPVTSPSMSPIISLLPAPVLSPIITTTTRPTLAVSDTTTNKSQSDNSYYNNSNSALIGIIIGCFGGGFGIAALIGLFIMSNNNQRNSNNNSDTDPYKDIIRSNPSALEQRMYDPTNHQHQYRGDGTESNTENDFAVHGEQHCQHHHNIPPPPPSPTYTSSNNDGSSSNRSSTYDNYISNHNANGQYNNTSSRSPILATDDDDDGRYKRDFTVYMVHPDAFENATPAPPVARLKSPPSDEYEYQ